MRLSRPKQNRLAFLSVKCILYVIFFAMMVFLLLCQAKPPVPNTYLSDLPPHLNAYRNPDVDSYSLLYALYWYLSTFWGNHYAVCILLAACEIATIAYTEHILAKMLPDSSSAKVLILAFLCNLVTAIYCPRIHSFRYLGLLTGNLWHNSTYLFMRLTALFVLTLYHKIDGYYLTKALTVKDYVAFTALLILVNMFKPNFLLAFAPAMLIMLIYDFVKTKGKSFKQAVIFGTTVLVSLTVILYQYIILFGSESSDSGIAVGFAVLWKIYHQHILFALFQSLAFPFFVAATNIRQIKGNRHYLFAWLMLLVALAEYVFLYETGARYYHANFAWGAQFATFYIFIISCVIFINACKKKSCKKLCKATGFILLGLHAISGLSYFGHILAGGLYH